MKKALTLRRIVDFIGRREFDPPSDRIRLSPFGKNRIQTVCFSDSINNLLPMEAAKLLNPSLKRKFYADMLEGKLLSYQLLGKHYTGPPRIKPRGSDDCACGYVRVHARSSSDPGQVCGAGYGKTDAFPADGI